MIPSKKATATADEPASEPKGDRSGARMIAPAFVARDLGDCGADFERRFDFALTYDRELVTRAARAMMRRIAAAGDRTPPPLPTLASAAICFLCALLCFSVLRQLYRVAFAGLTMTGQPAASAGPT